MAELTSGVRVADPIALLRCAQGDGAARAELVDRYLPMLMKWAHGRLPSGSRVLSETVDLVHLAVDSALASAAERGLHHEGDLINHLRTAVLRRIQQEIRASAEAESRTGPDSLVEHRLGRAALLDYESSLTDLDAELREALILRIEFGLSFAEIAAAMDLVDADAARAAVARAMRILTRQPDIDAEALFAALDQGRPIDWQAARACGGDALVEQLRQIERLCGAFTSVRQETTDAVSAPRALFHWGHLRVQSVLGMGAYATVYRCYDTVLEREVALKLRHRDAPVGPWESRTFIDEARRLARVRHPNVLAVLGAAVHDDRAGLWTDLIEGQTAADRLRSHGACSTEEVFRILESLAAALAAVHGASLVHGDVKAANVMLDLSGRVVLMDFGAGGELEGPASGATAGSPLYMAPELFAGARSGAAADVYALGVLGFLLCTGSPPIDEAGFESLRASMRQHGRRIRAALSRVRPRPLRDLLRQALASDPKDRPTALELRDRLAWLRTAPQRRRRALLATAAIVLLAGIAVALAWGIVEQRRLRDIAEQQTAQAERQAAQARAAAIFLVRIIERTDPTYPDRGASLSAAELLERAAQEIESAFADAPELDALITAAIAESLFRLEGARRAAPLIDRAIKQHGENAALDAQVRVKLFGVKAVLDNADGDPEAAEQAALRELELLEGAVGQGALPAKISALTHIAKSYSLRNRNAEALETYRHVLELRRQSTESSRASDLAMDYSNIAAAQLALERYAESEASYREAVEQLERELGAEHPRLYFPLVGLGSNLTRLGRFDEARAVMQRTLDLARRSFSANHPHIARVEHNRAAVELWAGNFQQARRFMDLAEASLGPVDHDPLLRSAVAYNRAELLLLTDQPVRAMAKAREAVAAVRGLGQSSHALRAQALLAYLESVTGGPADDAEHRLGEVVEAARQGGEGARSVLFLAAAWRADVLARLERLDEARASREEANTVGRQLYGAENPAYLRVKQHYLQRLEPRE